MSGGLRLGIGYTLLVIAAIALIAGAVLQVSDVTVSGSSESCEENMLGQEECQTNEGEVDADGIGLVFLLPGVILGIVAAPLVVSGHIARKEDQGSGAGGQAGGQAGAE